MQKIMCTIFLISGMTGSSFAMEGNGTTKTQMLKAVQKGNLPLVQMLIKKTKLDLNFKNLTMAEDYYSTPLEIAVENGLNLIAHELLEGGARPSDQNFYTHLTPLHTVVSQLLNKKGTVSQKREIMDLLLSHGADITVKGTDNNTIFHMCASHYVSANRRQDFSAVSGVRIFGLLVHRVCATQGALLKLALEQEKNKKQKYEAQFMGTIEKIKRVLKFKNDNNKTVEEIFSKNCQCRYGHSLTCPVTQTTINQDFIDRIISSACD